MIKIRCSSLPRLAECPGSLFACEGLQSTDSAVSLAGSAGHVALERYYGQFLLAGDTMKAIDAFTDTLDDQTASRCRWYAKQVDEIIASHGGAISILTEHEMSFPVADGIYLTGHCDLIVICVDGVHLVIDYKFNYLEVPRASRNLQIAGYVVLWANECSDTNEIHGILVAGGNDDPFTATAYNRESVKKAIQKLTDIVQSAILRDVRNPSEDACKYCQARCSTRCPETLESLVMPPTDVVLRDNLLPANKLEAANLRKLAKQYISLAEKYIDRIDEDVRLYPEEWAEFFTLQSTGSTRKIESAQEAYRVMVEESCMLSAADFLGLVTVPIGKLEAALKPALVASGVPVKDHKALVATMLGSNLILEEKAQSVKAVVK